LLDKAIHKKKLEKEKQRYVKTVKRTVAQATLLKSATCDVSCLQAKLEASGSAHGP